MGLHEVPQDPHAQELGMFPTIEHPELGTYTTVNIPMRFATADVKPQGPAPLLGQHSEQILRDFGMDAAACAAGRWHGKQKPVAVDIEALLAAFKEGSFDGEETARRRYAPNSSLTLGIPPYWIPTEPGARVRPR